MPNTKDIGDISQVMVMAAFLRAGLTVLTPFGDNRRYDLVLEQDGVFHRIQCKTARRSKRHAGSLLFDTCSSYAHRGGKKKDYRGDVDFFAAYSPDLDKVFVLPVESVGITVCSLRLKEAKNKQTKNTRWAEDYEFSGELPS